jgi:hypothetical protein
MDRIIGRDYQIKQLQIPAPLVYVNGLPNTGKTYTVKRLFGHYKWINCQEITSLSMLNYRIKGQMNLVFDKIEFIKQHIAYLLAKLENQNIVMIGNCSWDDFGYHDPLIVHFPAYSAKETLDIVTLDCPEDQEPEFYYNFAEMIYTVFSPLCRDLKQFRYVINTLFPKYIEPVMQGKASKDQRTRLFTFVQPHIKSVLRKLYLSLDFRQIELPTNAKYLLIASFLASFNPSRLDKRYFTKNDSSRQTKGSAKAFIFNQDPQSTSWPQSLFY